MRHNAYGLLLAAGIILASPPLAFSQPVQPQADLIQTINQELIRLSTQPREVAVARVQELARLRLIAFTKLAQADPSRALSLALPESTLVRLRAFAPDLAASLEEDGDWSGPAQVVVEDDFEHRASRRHISIQSGGEWREVHFTDPAPEIRSGAVITARGLRAGSIIVAREASLSLTPASIGCSSIGPQKLAILIVNFSGASVPAALNSTTLGAMVSGGGHSLNAYWNEASYGSVSATADVFGPFNLGANYTTYNAVETAAINAAATSGGVTFQNYNHVVIVMPNNFPTGGGLGTVGCTDLTSPTTGAFTAGVVWLRSDFIAPGGVVHNDIGVCGLAHEDGHNMGLGHASSESYGNIPLGSIGTVPTHDEYGDRFSLMGLCYTINGTTLLGHYAAQHKVQLGWMGNSNYQNVTASGTYTLAPIENSSSGLQAIRVQRGANDLWLWLEQRKSTGYDTTFSALDGQVYSGALIHYEDPSNQAYIGYTRLLNFTAPTDSVDFNEPALAAGSSWSDPYSLLSLNVTSIDSAGLHVTVHYDTPCATLTPANRSYSPSAVTSDSVTVTASGPCLWTAVSNNSWISVTGGTSGSGSGSVGYSVTANSGPSPRTGTITIARQNFTITQASTNPQPTPVSVTPSNGASAVGTPQTFSFVYSDGDGAADLTEVSFLVNSTINTAAACYVAWFSSDNTIRLYDDAGDGAYTFGSAVGSNSFGNSQCTVSYSNPVAKSGNNVTLTLSIAFSGSFTGTQNIYMEAQDAATADSGLKLLGTRIIGTLTSITVTTSPGGLQIIADGVTLTAPQSFNWVSGSSHTLNVTSPQGSGTRYLFGSWSDTGAQSHTVVTPVSTTTYTANFTTQYLLTTNVSPGGSGAVNASPSSGDGYYNSGASVQLTAAPAAGFVFSAFSGDLTGGSNPQSVSMTAARTVTATFSPIAPSVGPVAPGSGTGATQTFSGTYTQSTGYHNLQWVQMLFATAPDGGGQPYCFVHYDVQGNGLWLYGDGGFFLGPIAPGTPSNVLQNSLCALNTSASTVSGSGATLTVNANLVFKSTVARNVYMRAHNLAGADTGFMQTGTWNLTTAALGTMSLSPSSGSGGSQTFTLTYPDPAGFAGAAFGWEQFLIAAATDGGGLPFCFVHYDRGGNGLWMYSSDVGFFLGPVNPGTASGALHSSACSINTAGATVANTSGNLVLTVPVTMNAPMSGAKKSFQRTLDVLNRDSGFQQTGTWTIP